MLDRSHRPLLATLLTLALLSPVVTRAEIPEGHATCHPSPELADVIDDLEHGPECGGAEPCWRERIERTEALLAEHPDELHLHRAYQDLFRTLRGDDAEEAWNAMAAGYLERAEQNPDDPTSLYLAARVGTDEATALGQIEHGLSLDPGFPWLHMGRASLLGRSGTEMSEAEKKQAILGHIETFERLCPRNLNGLSHARWVEAPDFWQPRLSHYRELLADDTAGRELASYRHLWTLDFALTPVAEHAAVRERIRGDLAHLATRDRANDEMWWMVRRQGAQMLGDPAALEALDQEMGDTLPCSTTAVKRRLEPFDTPAGPAEETTDTLQKKLAASAEWVALCPEDFRSHFLRFVLVLELARRGELEKDDLVAECDRMLAVWEKNRRQVRMSGSPYRRVAKAFLDHGIELDRVEALLDAEEALAEKNRIPLDQLPEDARPRFAAGQVHGEIVLQMLRLRLALAEDEGETARYWLSTLEASVAEYTELSDEPEFVARQQANLSWARGLLAEHEERWLDALLLYRHAIQGRSRDIDEAALAETIETLWRRLGGTGEGRALLDQEEAVVSATEPALWRERGEALPELELSDLEGKTWRREDFLGTTTLINFWATTCGPCRLELPHLQKLAEELEPRGIRVVTFNIDDNVGLIEPFTKSEGLELPVVLATKFFREQGLSAVPTSWIVDPEGVIRHQQVGFSPLELEQWAEQTRGLLLEAAGEDG